VWCKHAERRILPFVGDAHCIFAAALLSMACGLLGRGGGFSMALRSAVGGGGEGGPVRGADMQERLHMRGDLPVQRQARQRGAEVAHGCTSPASARGRSAGIHKRAGRE